MMVLSLGMSSQRDFSHQTYSLKRRNLDVDIQFRKL